MAGKREAHYQNRTYYYHIVEQSDNEISIEMYSTPYTFVRNKEGWVNHHHNKFTLNPELLQIIVMNILGR